MLRFLAFVLLLSLSATARAEIDFAFAGGALVPQGEMDKSVDGGLDLAGRFGFRTRSGLGAVLALDYALLRRPDLLGDGTGEDVRLFSATAAPRFTLGKDTVRLWLAAGPGLVLDTITASATLTAAGGLDLHLFGHGGLTLSGGYTRSLGDAAATEYLSVNAGVVFEL